MGEGRKNPVFFSLPLTPKWERRARGTLWKLGERGVRGWEVRVSHRHEIR
jgi:hypothetical protein